MPGAGSAREQRHEFRRRSEERTESAVAPARLAASEDPAAVAVQLELEAARGRGVVAPAHTVAIATEVGSRAALEARFGKALETTPGGLRRGRLKQAS